jgi:hypothetical protein
MLQAHPDRISREVLATALIRATPAPSGERVNLGDGSLIVDLQVVG